MAIGSILLGLATSVGLPVLTKILQGDNRGAIDTVVNRVATELGVEPTPEVVQTAVEADPARAAQVMQTVETDYAAIANAAASATESYHDLLETDQKSDKILARIWRPFNGMIFALECAALVGAFVYCMVSGQTDTIQAAAAAFGFLGTVLTVHAGVVGVYTYRRTTEKIANGK